MRIIKHIEDKEFNAAFPDDSRCERYLHHLRAKGDFRCINDKCYCLLLDYVPHYKRKYLRCKGCQHKEYPAAGTLFENNHRGLKVCFDILYYIISAPGGISISGLKKKVGGSPDSLKTFVEKIHAQCEIATNFYFNNPQHAVQVDESYIKTSPKGLGRNFNFAQGRGSEWNTAYGVITDHISGITKTFPLPGIDSDTFDDIFLQRVSKDSKIYTDQFPGYNNLKNLGFAKHQTVNHKQEWVRGEIQTQATENFHSNFKRTVRNHRSISDHKLPGYLALESFRKSFRTHYDFGFKAFLQSIPGYNREL